MSHSHNEVCHQSVHLSRDRCADGTCNAGSCPPMIPCNSSSPHRGPDGLCYATLTEIPPYLGCVAGEYWVVGCRDVVIEIVPIRSLCH